MDHYKDIGARLSNWGRWGELDVRGTLNLITPERVAAAGGLIKTGRVFELGTCFGGPEAGMGRGHRPAPIHLMSMMPDDLHLEDGSGFAEDLIVMPLHTATHWDGLAHCFYDGRLYNGYPSSTITATGAATQLGIDRLGGGVVGRGVLLDIATLYGVVCLAHGTPISPADLEAAERRQRVVVQPGDIVLVRTGWSQRARARHPVCHRVSSALQLAPEAGLSQDCCVWLHGRQVAALAADNYAIEVLPSEDSRALLPLHCILIRDMGMTLGELFALDALAAACEADGSWEFFFAAPPLKVANGLGSPVGPIAIK